MQRDETYENEARGLAAASASGHGRAQMPAPPEIEQDVATIRELLELLARLRVNLTAHARDDLIDPLALLDAAANRRETDAKPVREALQRVLLTVGTGALATLSGPARRRLAALTGIALPGCETHTA